VALISIVVFTIIQLPPGDYLTTLEADIAARVGARRRGGWWRRCGGTSASIEPLHTCSTSCGSGASPRGDFGISFEVRRPVRRGDRAAAAAEHRRSPSSPWLFMWLVAVPIGIYSATHRYSPQDHAFTFFGFLGLATPDFLFAMTIVVLSVYVFGLDYTGGLFSSAYRFEPWSLAKVVRHAPPRVGSRARDRLGRHRGTHPGHARQPHRRPLPGVRPHRACEGRARARVVYKHAVRVAINPLVSIAGMQLPQTISRETVTAIVLGLPTAGPLLYRSLISQDMYVAGNDSLVPVALAGGRQHPGRRRIGARGPAGPLWLNRPAKPSAHAIAPAQMSSCGGSRGTRLGVFGATVLGRPLRLGAFFAPFFAPYGVLTRESRFVLRATPAGALRRH
jgi:peptide/nickel transport system permease protein